MDDNTTHITKAGSEANPFQPVANESRIFNTSVRGWIALIVTVGLVLCMFLVFVCYFTGVQLPETFVSQLLTLFTTAVTAAVTFYFANKSQEGKK